MLLECDNLLGEATINRELPSFKILENTIYMPKEPNTGYDSDINYGIYDNNGVLVKEAAYRRWGGGQLVGQSERIALDLGSLQYDDFEGIYVYLGPLYAHYGHFLVTTLARAWFFLKHNLTQPIRLLTHPIGDQSQFLDLPVVQAFIQRFHFTREMFVAPTNPTIVRKIIVPSPSFEELNFAYTIHAELCQAIGEKLNNFDLCFDDQPIFLSKACLQHGIWRFVNEDILIERLDKLGFKIVFPENLTLEEQVSLFSSHAKVGGIAGSALHTMLFSKKKHDVLGLYFERAIQSNFQLIDEVLGNNAKYLYPQDLTEVEPGGSFHRSFRLMNPKETAEEFAELFNTMG